MKKLFILISISICLLSQAQTPNADLRKAIIENDVAGIKAAVKAGADVNKGFEHQVVWKGSFGSEISPNCRPMLLAVMHDNYEATLALFRLGAKPSLTTKSKGPGLTFLGRGQIKSIVNITPLYMAIDHDNAEIVKLLLQTKKAKISMEMTVATKGKIQVALGQPASLVGYTAKKFAKLLGRDALTNIMTNYRKKSWYTDGIPQE